MMRIRPPARGSFSRSCHLVLPLRLGFGIFSGATCGFLAIAAGVTAVGPAFPLDQTVAVWFHTHRTPGLSTAMHLATGLGSTAWVTGMALCAALTLTWRRRWFGLLTFGMAVPGGMVLSVILKTAFHRFRSGPEMWSATFPGCGFPSGYTVAATLLYDALAACEVDGLANRRVRGGAVFGVVAMVGLVGFSRLALGAHYLSDVVAAAAAGLAWLAFCFTAVDALRRQGSAQGHP